MRAQLRAQEEKLSQTETWLDEYGEYSDLCEKFDYEKKLKALKMIAEATKKRKSEFEGRKAAAEALGHSLQMTNKAVGLYKEGDEKYNHLSLEEISKVAKLIGEYLVA